jgi:2-polyprenyl-6-methoxyphenol hydroxylase-like FAD-dependent oxidoreductase
VTNLKINADVCIVGAGPGGALLGYLLAKNNIQTVVLERNTTIDKEFRGEHLNDTGEQILKKHNLFKKVEEQGLLAMERIEYCDHGRAIETIFPSTKGGHLGIHVPQNHLLTVLINEAFGYENYKLMMNTTVNELIQDENGRYIGVKANSNGEEAEVYSSIIIGADGRYSTVRKLAGIPYTKRKHGFEILWAKITAPEGWEPTIRNALIDGEQLALFSQAGGFLQIGWNIKEGTYPTLREQSFEPFINKLIAAFPQLEDSVRQQIKTWNDFIFLPLFSSRVEQWTKDGLILIGDAVHTMTPTGAFGINSSLKDADMLAETIINLPDLKNCTTSDFLLFVESRKQETAMLQKQQIDKELTFKDHFLIKN